MEGSVQQILSADYGLDDHIINALEQLTCLSFPYIEAEEIFHRTETPLAAVVLFILVIADDILSILLIDTVIGQVLIPLVFAIVGRRVVLFSRESSETFVVYVDSQRVDADDGHVYAQVELQPVDE